MLQDVCISRLFPTSRRNQLSGSLAVTRAGAHGTIHQRAPPTPSQGQSDETHGSAQPGGAFTEPGTCPCSRHTETLGGATCAAPPHGAAHLHSSYRPVLRKQPHTLTSPQPHRCPKYSLERHRHSSGRHNLPRMRIVDLVIPRE